MERTPSLDEMVDGHGGLRPAWRGVLGAFTALGGGGLHERAERLAQAFAEEGVSSILPGGAGGTASWACDPVPLPLSAAEFLTLEAGLAQRAGLLEAILADVHGANTLLASGALPPALVYPNPGFLRAAGPHAGPFLHAYAADLIRGPDGAWRVLADRTDHAAGIGYALENRRLLSRVLPEAFRPVQVRQLRPFFDIWQDALQRLGPVGASGRPKANPSIAVLTPGNTHPRWFEHMSLARELSCALVEAGDLTVRGGGVFLKTLKGLQQVDVLLRRVDGPLLDPLELEGPTAAGVPGLLDAVRHGSLRIVNAPGAAIVQAPALSAFLPALSMKLLEEQLLLASVPTLWLGQEQALTLVRQEPGRWLVRPAVDGAPDSVHPASLPPAERAALMAAIEAKPWAWAATLNIAPSVAPCLSSNPSEGLEPRAIILRMFLVHDGAAWRAMPGGLGRVLDAGDAIAGRLPSRGLSKDVWVLTEDRADLIGPSAPVVAPLRLRRTAGDLPSRVADNLFWLGRYVERLERAARLIRAAVARLARGGALLPRELAEIQALGRCMAEAGFLATDVATAATPTLMAEALMATVRTGGSVERLFGSVARLTESVRDRLTGDMYGAFTGTLRAARTDAAAGGRSLDGLSHAMVTVLRFSTVVAGLAAENMVRGGGWLFLDLGRRLERAQSVAAEVSIAIGDAPSRIENGLRLALELCDSAITYRTRYLNVLQPAPVLDLVLADQGNPRGLAFQLAAMHGLMEDLIIEGASKERLPAVAAGLLADIEMMVDSVLVAPDQAQAAVALAPRLMQVAAGVSALSNRVTRRYFALLPALHTLGWQGDDARDEEPPVGDKAA